MRIQSSVTSISWIPSEAVRRVPRAPFVTGVAHYDEPPPDEVGKPEERGREDEPIEVAAP